MTTKELESLKAEGWTFETEEWDNPHNGDPETDYRVKSPRLHNAFSVYTQYDTNLNRVRSPWKWMTRIQMLAREKDAYVLQRMMNYENQNAIEDAVERVLHKDPDAKKVTVTIELS